MTFPQELVFLVYFAVVKHVNRLKVISVPSELFMTNLKRINAFEDARIDLVIRARKHFCRGEKRLCIPVTHPILPRILPPWRQLHSSLAFAGFLGSGEFTWTGPTLRVTTSSPIRTIRPNCCGICILVGFTELSSSRTCHLLR